VISGVFNHEIHEKKIIIIELRFLYLVLVTSPKYRRMLNAFAVLYLEYSQIWLKSLICTIATLIISQKLTNETLIMAITCHTTFQNFLQPPCKGSLSRPGLRKKTYFATQIARAVSHTLSSLQTMGVNLWRVLKLPGMTPIVTHEHEDGEHRQNGGDY